MTSTAAARRAYDGPALFSFGFRPCFFFGAIWSALVVPLWLYSYFHGGAAALTREWHIHEMIFGFLGAVIAGFLTTAVPNWTGRMPVIGAPLGFLVSLWVLGRVAMLFQGVLGPIAAVADCAFLLAFAAVIWREVLAGRNWRNLPVCILISLFGLANVAFHLPSAQAGDLGAHRLQGGRGLGRRHGHQTSGGNTKAVEAGLRQADLVGRDHQRVVADHRRGQQADAASGHLDPALAGQPHGPQRGAVAGQEDDIFAEGVERHGAGRQGRGGPCNVAGGFVRG